MNTAPPPARQCMQALALANEKRLARAQLRRDVKSGAVVVADLLRELPAVLREGEQASHHTQDLYRWTITELLSWQHRWGLRRASNFLRAIDVSPTLKVVHISPVTMDKIIEALP